MLITNNTAAGHDHLSAITDCFEKAEKADLVVAYVQQTGVNLLQSPLARIGRAVRLICSLDMDVTDPAAIKNLMAMGVKVKVYRMDRGTMHAKLWLFKEAHGHWQCIVGSANLSAGGLRNNVEASARLIESENPDALAMARRIFGFLWNSDGCDELTDRDIDTWISSRRERRKMISRIRQIQSKAKQPSTGAQVKVLREFVKGWIDIGVHEKTTGSGVTGKMWRGWYIIPDQGYVDDALMNRLHGICQIMHRADGGAIDISQPVKPPLDAILKITEEKLLRSKRKMPLRSLFVRQEKNYLTHFEFARHPVKPGGKPDKKILALTEYGAQFARAGNVREQKQIYTAAMQQYVYNGLPLLEFTHGLLREIDKINLTEFSFFANHAYAIGEVGNIAALIQMYRNLPRERKILFKKEMDDYFKVKLEPSAKNVRGNYDKSAKHTMSALGWCEGLYFNLASCELSLRDES